MRTLLSLVLGCGLLAAQKPAVPARTAAPKAAAVRAAAQVPAVAKPAPPAQQTAKIDPAAAPVEPKAVTETLRFEVTWPSGLSLGEGEMTSTFDGAKHDMSFKVEAAVPGFAVVESATSVATPNFCSLEFNKSSERGKRKAEEQTIFDAGKLTAARKTLKIGTAKSDGKSEMKIGSCPKDALTFLYFLRRELVAGRLPASQPVYYGGPYPVRVQYIGTQSVRSGAEMIEADKLTATIKNASGEFAVSLLFARDAKRTPISVTIPVAVGKFTVEFSR